MAMLTIDQWIQLGMLVAAVLGLVGPIAWKVGRMRKKPKLGIKPVKLAPTYVHRVRFENPAVVETVGVWFQIEFYNHSQSALVLTKIECAAGNAGPQAVLGVPVKHLESTLADATPSDAIELPYAIDVDHALKCFVLCAIPVPDSLGQYLCEKFARIDGRKIPTKPVMLKKELSSEIVGAYPVFGIEITGFNAHISGIAAPLLQQRNGVLTIDAKLGRIPLAGMADYLRDKNLTPGRYFATYNTYAIRLCFSNGMTSSASRYTEGDPLWFQNQITD